MPSQDERFESGTENSVPESQRRKPEVEHKEYEIAPQEPLPAALPDYRSYEKAWAEIQAVLHPIADAGYAEIDEDLLCPITQCLIRDPVTTADGQTYEREAITQWFKSGKKTSPASGAQLKNQEVIDAIMARKMIDKAITKDPTLGEMQYLPGTWVDEMATACVQGEIKAIQALVQKDKRLLITPHKETQHLPLHQAILREDSLVTLIELLERRQPGLALASFLEANAAGQLPLEIALSKGKSIATLLKLMAWMGDALVFFQLSRPLPAQAQPILTALLQDCILRGNLVWLHQVITWGADANTMTSKGESVLCLAIRLGNVEMVSVLLAADANANGKTPEGLPVLSLAMHQKNPDLVRTLLEAHADLESSQSSLGDNALQLAVRLGDIILTALLCEKGASITAVRRDGQTALHAAAQQRDLAFLERLLAEKGASQVLNTPDVQGFTPLHVAALQGHEKAVAVLLAQKARWDLPDKEGNTVLHIAARSSSAAVMELLLLAGADKDVENRAGQTPQELAESQGPHVLAAYTQASEKLAQQAAKALEAQGMVGMATMLLRQQQQLEDLGRMFRFLRKELLEKEQVHAISLQEQQVHFEQRLQAQTAEQSLKQKAVAEGLEKANLRAEQTEKQRAEDVQRVAYELERERRVAAIAEKQRVAQGLSKELVLACEQGDEKAVETLLLRGANPSVENAQGVYPLGAAVWGMNPEIINRLMAEVGGIASMSWEECEAHNRKYYKEVFIFTEFAPTTYGEWHGLLLKMNRSPFLAAKHFAEIRKLWRNEDVSSWERFVAWLEGECRGGGLFGRGGHDRKLKGSENYRGCPEGVRACGVTDRYHSQLMDSIMRVLGKRYKPEPKR